MISQEDQPSLNGWSVRVDVNEWLRRTIGNMAHRTRSSSCSRPTVPIREIVPHLMVDAACLAIDFSPGPNQSGCDLIWKLRCATRGGASRCRSNFYFETYFRSQACEEIDQCVRAKQVDPSTK